MDFVIIEEEDLLEDSNIHVNNSAIVFNNNRVRVIVFILLIYSALLCYALSVLRPI
jgi:hypothetical protein